MTIQRKLSALLNFSRKSATSQSQYWKNKICDQAEIISFAEMSFHRGIWTHSYSPLFILSSPIIAAQLLFCHLAVCIPFAELQKKSSVALAVKLFMISERAFPFLDVLQMKHPDIEACINK